MPYLAFDLDGKKNAARCARAVGVDPGVIAWGLLELWEHVWASKSDVVTEIALDGCFGPSDRIRQALIEFGFLEKVETGFRVRGAGRYLQVQAAQSAGGKTRAAGPRNKRGQLQTAAPPPPPITSSPPGVDQLPIQVSTSCPPGLTPSTQHPAPILLPSEVVAAPPPQASRPDIEFFAWCQEAREKVFPGVFPETPPASFVGWYPTALGAVGSPERLCKTWVRYLRDDWARQRRPAYAFGAFIARDKWRDYVPPAEVAA